MMLNERRHEGPRLLHALSRETRIVEGWVIEATFTIRVAPQVHIHLGEAMADQYQSLRDRRGAHHQQEQQQVVPDSSHSPYCFTVNVHSSHFQLTQSLAVARGVTYDCPRIAKAGAALALGPRVSVARTHVLPTLRRIWWLAGRQQAAPLPGERQKPAMLVSRVGW